MTYQEVEQKISEIPKFGAKASLTNLSGYLDKWNHPEKDLRVIHVAGTNGKGSVCSFIDSILRSAGYTTALFTSPHLITLRERFVENGHMVSEERVIDAFVRVDDLMKKGMEEGLMPMTYFEVLFLMGILLFSQTGPDYCILETGMGGRLDATVLCQPVLCIITSISLDHMKVLGDTIEEIAREKAGVMKPGIPVVTIKETETVFEVIKEEAEKKKSPLYSLAPKEITILKKTENYIDFSIYNSYYNFRDLRICSTAAYQTENGALAALALRILLPDLSEQAIKDGLFHMFWAGRMEEIEPGIYVDGAHNPGAVSRLLEDLKSSGHKWSLLFAVCEDKDYHTMISMLAGYPYTRIVVSGMNTGRGAPYNRICRLFESMASCPVTGFVSVKEAYNYAKENRMRNERLLCLGSLYLAGELKEMTQETKK